jgi:hypothetical protein
MLGQAEHLRPFAYRDAHKKTDQEKKTATKRPAFAPGWGEPAQQEWHEILTHDDLLDLRGVGMRQFEVPTARRQWRALLSADG